MRRRNSIAYFFRAEKKKFRRAGLRGGTELLT